MNMLISPNLHLSGRRGECEGRSNFGFNFWTRDIVIGVQTIGNQDMYNHEKSSSEEVFKELS